MDNSSKQNPVFDPNAQTVNQPQNTGFTPGVNKEHEVSGGNFVRASEPEHVLDQEVKEAGVKTVVDRPNLTDAHTQVGISHSLQNTEANSKNPKTITFPLNDKEVESLLKGEDKKSSAYWLSVLIDKVRKVLTLK